MATTTRTPVVRCDDCAIEFELFKDLAKVTRCTHGGSHRAVRVTRPSRA